MGGTINIEDFDNWLHNKKFGLGHDERDECDKPGCPVPKKWPKPDSRCTCNDPIWISIPPGSHIHLYCEVHGDRIIYGPDVTWCKPLIWKHEGPGPKVRMKTTEAQEFGSDNPWEVIC